MSPTNHSGLGGWSAGVNFLRARGVIWQAGGRRFGSLVPGVNLPLYSACQVLQEVILWVPTSSA